ncbi:thiazole synthase [Paucibacter sp. B2R-40]|uniref:thiazole synthase n=1 Tax=Paucibacter sp. B2R-40 TaxID=2893554 RepID=UPI0021E40642|nr:thiazole synthase [Paucibacter sp. B2R-40]MCV2357017.1 thiazole synthase [Paucibacter sp. B2R-40]
MLQEAKPDPWKIDDVSLTSRLLLGSAGYPNPQTLSEAIRASQTEVLTVGLKRSLLSGSQTGDNGFVAMAMRTAKAQGARLLPNTAGCRTAREAVQLACMARELYDTTWIKLEVIGDEHTLQPDPFELLAGAAELVKKGFAVLPYCTDDLVLCRRLLDAGCAVLMPWGAPIGSGQGLLNPFALRSLRERLPDATLIIDAGLGAPSHAARALELGFDAVLLNSAVAQAREPVLMAAAFRDAVRAGRQGYQAGLMSSQDFAVPSTPVSGHAFLLGDPP